MGRSPVARLTPVQFEIMQVVWDSSGGATVAEIWATVGRARKVTRTTVLNLVARLEQRRWLKRSKADGPNRYVATTDRATASSNAAVRFVKEFFGGSASDLVMSLIDANDISKSELDELRRLIERARAGGGSK